MLNVSDTVMLNVSVLLELLELHIAYFLTFLLHQVHYTFNKILMLQEPLLVVGAFYILFFTVIIYVRLDFSITKVWMVSYAAK